MERGRCPRLLQDRRADQRVSPSRRRSRRAGYSRSDCLRPGLAGHPSGAGGAAMKTVIVDKIASVTQACALGPELRLSNDIPAEEGVVIVAEVLNNKSTYNTLELTGGRMAKVVKGG